MINIHELDVTRSDIENRNIVGSKWIAGVKDDDIGDIVVVETLTELSNSLV